MRISEGRVGEMKSANLSLSAYVSRGVARSTVELNSWIGIIIMDLPSARLTAYQAKKE